MNFDEKNYREVSGFRGGGESGLSDEANAADSGEAGAAKICTACERSVGGAGRNTMAAVKETEESWQQDMEQAMPLPLE